MDNLKKVNNSTIKEYQSQNIDFYLWGNYTESKEGWIFIWDDVEKEILTNENPPHAMCKFNPEFPNVNYWYKNPTNVYDAF